MRASVEALLFAAAFLFTAPGWAFTPPASPAYCPWPDWKRPPAPPGEPIVYVDPHGVAYTKAQVDAAYDQVCWQQDAPDTTARDHWLSANAVASYGAPATYAYGSSPHERLDLYRARGTNRLAPTMIFIHGGAWRSGSASSYAYFAPAFVEAGANLVVLDFVNVTQTVGPDGKPDANLATMAEQVRAGVAWVYRNATSLGLDADRIYVSGHSSGGHLCGVVITTDWASRGLPKGFVKGAVCASGLYDLVPVALSARNRYIDFSDAAMIDDLSPVRHLDRIDMPVIVGHGGKETPEFRRQTEDFAQSLRAAGKPVQLIVAPGYNHFEFAETFANPYGPLGGAALRLMGLQPGGALTARPAGRGN